MAACTSLCLHSLNFEMLVNIHCFHFLTSHSSLTLFRLPPPHSTQRILISGSLTPNQIDGLAPICLSPNIIFLFFCVALSTCQYFAFSRHSVLVSILFLWVLNSLFSTSCYKSNHPLSVGPQSLPNSQEADNYMTFLTNSVGFFLFH